MRDSLSEALRKATAYKQELDEIEQILGKVLGFPWRYKDQAVFPGATVYDGVETGHLLTVDLAVLAATGLRKREVDALTYAEKQSLYGAKAGTISGRLSEWPVLWSALTKLNMPVDGSTLAVEVKALVKAELGDMI